MTGPREQFRPEGHENEHFLLTSVVGSYPKPKWHDRAKELFEDPDADFGETEWAESKDDAAKLITEEHEECGLDTVCDGEMRRNEMVEYFAELIDGYEFNGRVKVWGHNYFDKPSIESEVEYGEEWLVDEYKFAASVASRPVKVPITGPYTLARWAFNEAYETTEDATYALADLVNEEIERLVDAGAKYIQIDEPALAQYEDDHAIVGEALERIVDGIPEDVRIGLHVCYGDYSRIYPEMLDLAVDNIDLELSNSELDMLDVFEENPFTKDLSFGAVDVHDHEIEDADVVEDRIESTLNVIPEDQVWVDPDCGLKTRQVDEAIDKLEVIAEATEKLRGAVA